jgi:hypothetical protein
LCRWWWRILFWGRRFELHRTNWHRNIFLFKPGHWRRNHVDDVLLSFANFSAHSTAKYTAKQTAIETTYRTAVVTTVATTFAPAQQTTRITTFRETIAST